MAKRPTTEYLPKPCPTPLGDYLDLALPQIILNAMNNEKLI